MEAKIKAKELFEKFANISSSCECGRIDDIDGVSAKECAIIAVENEYHALRELIFLLRSNSVIENEKTVLHFIDLYIKEETEVKREIELL
jgi:hypothetical protein